MTNNKYVTSSGHKSSSRLLTAGQAASRTYHKMITVTVDLAEDVSHVMDEEEEETEDASRAVKADDKKSAVDNKDRSYGWHKMTNFTKYMEDKIGDHKSELAKLKFDDELQTDWYGALQFAADLVWNEYQVKQEAAHPNPKTALVNVDALDTVLLSLHPANIVSGMDGLSASTREALAELHRFGHLLLLREVGATEMEELLANLPETYPAMLALMAWFVTLASKMTGRPVPDVGMAPGGRIHRPEEEVAAHLANMVRVAEAMAKQKNWSYLGQYKILKALLFDLHTLAE